MNNLSHMFEVIISEMFKGNFSFAILIVSILQLVVMLLNAVEKIVLRMRNKDIETNGTVDKGNPLEKE